MRAEEEVIAILREAEAGELSAANVHDSQNIEALWDSSNTVHRVRASSAYAARRARADSSLDASTSTGCLLCCMGASRLSTGAPHKRKSSQQ